MRALFVTGSLVHGGAERHSITLQNRLAERGHECHAVYVKHDPSQLERIRLRDGGTIACLHAQCYLDWRAIKGFAAHLGRLRPSVIVAANPYALMYASFARSIARLQAPLVATFHSTHISGLRDQAKMALERPHFWRADCCVFVCRRQKRHWLRRAVFARRNVVIYNGVDTEHFRDARAPAEQARVRAACRFTERDFVIGVSAVLRPEKNHLHLLEALAALRRHGQMARAMLIGDGEMRPAIEARARALGIAPDVAITGLQIDVRPYLSACDVIALPSITEAFSLAALEAMAMARPVVHSRVGGAAEMIRDGWNGYLHPPGNTNALVARLSLLADPRQAAWMGRNARDVAETQFSERAMVDRYERLLLELCNAQTLSAETVPAGGTPTGPWGAQRR